MESHPISPLGPVKLAITMDDMLLFRGVPVPKNYSCLGIARAMTQAAPPPVVMAKRKMLLAPARGVRNMYEVVLAPKSKMRAQFVAFVARRTCAAIVRSLHA